MPETRNSSTIIQNAKLTSRFMGKKPDVKKHVLEFTRSLSVAGLWFTREKSVENAIKAQHMNALTTRFQA